MMLAQAFLQRGYGVDFIAFRAEGELLDELPTEIRVVELKPMASLLARGYGFGVDVRGLAHVVASPTVHYLRDLTQHLRTDRPPFLFTSRPYVNVEASLAVHRANAPTRLVIGEYNDLSHSQVMASWLQRRYLPPIMRRAYLRAHAILAVSDGVSDDLAATTAIPRHRIDTVYPPLPPELPDKAAQPIDHPWFAPGEPPVVLGVGRLTRAKDYPTLLRAFARVHMQRRARLVILGEARSAKKAAKRRDEYMTLAHDLGIAGDTAMLGYVKNPFAFMARASVFALSSITEGFGMVVAEALACGCPVVSTDCPSGPAEILEGGKYGSLVPVKDHRALGDAILNILDSTFDRDFLRSRAHAFSLSGIVDQYENIMRRDA